MSSPIVDNCGRNFPSRHFAHSPFSAALLSTGPAATSSRRPATCPFLGGMTPPLTNIDSIRANHPTFWTDLKNGTYLKPAPRVAVRRDHYHYLDFPSQLRLRAIAAARSAYTAVLISKSAARVHGLWVIATAEEKIEMALPTNTLPHKDRRHPERIYRKASLPEPVLVDGTRCVSKARAVIDVARYHGFTDGLIAADSALRSGLSREDLKEEFAHMGRVRNSCIVRAIIHHASPLSRSPYESFARALLIEADFPWPMFFEASFTALPGITTALCINNAYLIDIIPAKALAHQRERHRRLREAGFTVLCYTPRQLIDHPTCFLSDLISTITARQKAARSA